MPEMSRAEEEMKLNATLYQRRARQSEIIKWAVLIVAIYEGWQSLCEIIEEF
jgi:hypothetical protein